MTDWPILSVVTFLPLFGALFIFAIKGEDEVAIRNTRFVALWTTSVTFILSLLLWVNFDQTTAEFQFIEKSNWLGERINYHMGVDGISVLFVLLTTFLIPLLIFASWNVTTRVKEYMIAFLFLETLIIGVFCALDLLLFYIFFEASLIPIFLIIGIWGGKERVQVGLKYVFYTLIGSVFMLLGLMTIYWQAGTTDIPILLAYDFDVSWQTYLWFAFFISLSLKMFLWPAHAWLPRLLTETPTTVLVVLIAILCKMGAYGFLRFSLPMFPVATEMFAGYVFWLSVITIIYTSLVALVQTDIKKMMAYGSVAQMGFVTMGIFTLTQQGVQGSIFHMLSHGIVFGGLFLCVGVMIDRMQTTEVKAFGGLVNRMPVYAFCFMIFTLGAIAMPGTSGFVGIFLTLVGAFQVNIGVAICAATGLILSAVYVLWLYRRMIFGELEKESLKSIMDINRREIFMMIPLILLTIFFGVYPSPVLDLTALPVENLITDHKAVLSVISTDNHFSGSMK